MLRKCLTDFRKAGADIITTPTYQAAVETLRRTPKPIAGADDDDGEHGATDSDQVVSRAEIISAMRRAVQVAVDAWNTVPNTNPNAGSVFALGPYGACMSPAQEYTGKYGKELDSEEGLYAWHLARLRFFKEAISPGAAGEDIPGGDVDLLSQVRYMAFETIPRADEVRAVRRAMSESGLAAEKPFWITCVFPNDGDDTCFLPDGTHVSKVVQSMLSPLPLAEEPGPESEEKTTAPAPKTEAAVPFGIGVNCTKLQKLPGLVHELEMGVHESLLDGAIERPPTMVLYPDGTKGEKYNSTTMKWEKAAESCTHETDREVSHLLHHNPHLRRVHPELLGSTAGTNFKQVSWEDQLSKIVNDLRFHGLFKSFIIGGCCKTGPALIKQLADRLEAEKA